MQFQIRYYRSDMAEYRRRQPREMSDIERVETIARLRRHGWSYAKIGEVVGLSANGVMHALRRATQPGTSMVCLTSRSGILTDNAGHA
jgi:lambda repressor-like predicted transcriptional regulator